MTRVAARMARSAIYSASAAVVAWAGLVVPLPFVEYIPGSPTDIVPLIEFEGVEAGVLEGRTAMLTVTLKQQPTIPTLLAVLDPNRDLQRVERIYPPDLDREEYLELQRDRFGRQFEVAAAVGAQAAGFDADLVTEVVVVDVVQGGPSDGVLEIGDVITHVEGRPIRAAEELQSAVQAQRVGDTLTVTVAAGGQQAERAVRLGAVEGFDGPRLGVAIHTAVDELRLPFEIRLTGNTRIGGPSAGLMIGLTVYDLLADEDLVGGRVVVGTGTLDADGSVGAVGGVPEKIRAASTHGADVILVPAAQLEQARSVPTDIPIVGVSSLDEAIDALRTS